MPKHNWIFAYSSVIGNSHISEKLPCQDACKVYSQKNYTIAVVCDGAGTSENSDVGSQNVSDYCIYQFKKLISSTNWHKKKKLPSQKAWHKKAKKTFRLVKEDLERFARNKEWDIKSLSCTVIVNIILKNGLLVTHIGDGRSGYCNFSDEWSATITPFHGELANQTAFITSEIWDESIIDNYIESRTIKDDIKAVCILSDGCEKSSFECNLYNQESKTYFDPNKPYPPFFNPNIQILPDLHRQGKTQDEINFLWQTFLKDGTEKLKIEPDDKTLILGVRIID